MSDSPRARYATKAKVAAAVEAARGAGLDVAGIELAPDGTIRVLGSNAFTGKPLDEFERFERAGLLG